MSNPKQTTYSQLDQVATDLGRSFAHLLSKVHDLKLPVYAKLELTRTATMEDLPPDVDRTPAIVDPSSKEFKNPELSLPSLGAMYSGVDRVDNPTNLEIIPEVTSDGKLNLSKCNLNALDWSCLMLSAEFVFFLSTHHPCQNMSSDRRSSATEEKIKKYLTGSRLAILPDQGKEVSEEQPLPEGIVLHPERYLYIDEEAKEALYNEFGPREEKLTGPKINSSPNIPWNMIKIRLNPSGSGLIVSINGKTVLRKEVDQAVNQHLKNKTKGGWNDSGDLLINIIKSDGKYQVYKYDAALRKQVERLKKSLKVMFSINKGEPIEKKGNLLVANFLVDSD